MREIPYSVLGTQYWVLGLALHTTAGHQLFASSGNYATHSGEPRSTSGTSHALS